VPTTTLRKKCLLRITYVEMLPLETILCTTHWMSSSLTSAVERVCMPRIICSGHAWCHVLPLLIAMHHICQFSWHYTYSIHLHQLAVDFYWCNTHHSEKWIHTSYFKVSHGSGRPSIFNLTYLRYPLIAVQWHNLHVLITCLNLQFHDTTSCQDICCLIFFFFFLYLLEVENLQYGTRNTSTTGSTIGMNKDTTHSEQ
jgi:hypothetical protein